MDPKSLFVTAYTAANGCVAHIRPADLAKPTPCKDWDVRQLLNHLVYELLWVPDMLAGRTVAEVGDAYEGDVLGDNVLVAWMQAGDKAAAAIRDAVPGGVVHATFGDIPNDEYIMQIAGETYIHGWDASQAKACSLRFDPAAAQTLLDYYQAHAREWQSSGLFAPSIDTPETASYSERLLGLLGRQPLAIY